MRRFEPLILTCMVLWLSACSTLPRPVVFDNDDATRQQAEVRTRWVGVTKFWTRTCPVPRSSGWTVRPLIPLSSLEPALAKSARKAKLDRFCVYEYKGDTPVSSRLKLPREIWARLRSIEPDRLVLSGMSLQTTTAQPFSQLFFTQVQLQNYLPIAGTSRVRLVFLDTQPTGEGIPQPPDPDVPPPPRSRHGYTLGHIAGNLAGPLACKGPNVPCAIEVASRLALPVVSFDPVTGQELVRDTTNGGYRGTFADLNSAILNEINDWLAIPAKNRPHLVLNLSVGWDGEKLGGWDEDLKHLTPGPWLIYGALQTAAQHGVLVIAAAGNERSGPNPTGHPLLPAGWEKPMRRLKGAWVWKNDLGAPLVYAASGVDGGNHPLVNTRKHGEAPRVVYADHVAVPDLNDPYQYTATLTGTSVAAAVISTIAAVVWSYQPELTPTQVMETLSQSGVPLPRKHDFSASSSPLVPDVRRITLCRAVAQARGTSFAACGPIPLATLDPSPPPGNGPVASIVPPPFPASQHPDMQEGCWNCPQPGSNPCPNCVIDPPSPVVIPPPEAALVDTSSRSFQTASLTGTNDPCRLLMLIEIPDGWTAGDLQAATLELFGFDSVTGRKVPLSGRSIDTSSLLESNPLVVTFAKPAEPFQAALSFVMAPPAGSPPGATPVSIVSPLFANCPGGQESSNAMTR